MIIIDYLSVFLLKQFLIFKNPYNAYLIKKSTCNSTVKKSSRSWKAYSRNNYSYLGFPQKKYLALHSSSFLLRN